VARGSVRFDHIALALPRIADAPGVLVGVLGGVPDGGAPAGAFSFGCWRFAGGGRIEVIEPRGEDGFLHRFLTRHGPGVHHVTFKVPDLVEACARSRAEGYDVVGFDDSNPYWQEAFLHPRQAMGIVVQLAQSPAPEPPRHWMPPPAPPNPPPPVRILGLRLRARSSDAARRQWGDVLRGQPVAPGLGDDVGRLRFRWPGSPMHVVVEIDPAAPEGPVCIEFHAGRRLALPAGRHPDLGVAFVEVGRASPGRPVRRSRGSRDA
jgi:methylmalonyl-CoA/ethylmalonyl-CoA epimerase